MIEIVSIHNGNIPGDVLKSQAAVMKHLQLDNVHRQYLTDLQHPEACDEVLANTDAEMVILMDIDCIPIHQYAITDVVRKVQSYNAIVGAAQNANHIIDCIDYASPAFVVIRMDLYEKAGRPSFVPTERGDVGTELTYACRANNVNIQLLPILSVEDPRWSLSTGEKFGIGTLYYPGIYHAFESRMNASARGAFIRKCEEVLNR
ncbi:MAG TPA: hypothetical protein PLI89_14245 [Chitinophagales bacterium]|nr:hypothetical protein [Chitinophagales bacterium]